MAIKARRLAGHIVMACPNCHVEIGVVERNEAVVAQLNDFLRTHAACPEPGQARR